MEQRAKSLAVWEELPRFTEIELEVLDFMEELRLARLRPSSPRRLPSFAWGSKRRRSAIDRSPSPPRTAGPSLSPPPPKKSKVSSPATTLAFPPSESEEKVSSSKPVKIVTLSKLPKKIEDLQKQCDSLSTEREKLLQVKEEMLIRKRKLEEEQSLLLKKVRDEVKKLQQQLYSESEPPATSLTLDSTPAQPTVNGHHHHHHHHRPLIVDRTAGERLSVGQASVLLPCSTREELFDLNVVPADEAPATVAAAAPVQAVFVNLRSLEMAEMARQNRMMRKEKIQSKNNGRFRAVR